MYALVFDNTFSKSLSKKATFVLMTYPTGSPPQAVHHHQYHPQGLTGDGAASSANGTKSRPKSSHRNSIDFKEKFGSRGSDEKSRVDESSTKRPAAANQLNDAEFFTGTLQKRRRKKHQGFARRFFALDRSNQTLSYYHDRNSLALRGTVPLSLAAIGANAKTRQISIDSGAEIWHLKALSDKDFEAWKAALDSARSPDEQTPSARPHIRSRVASMARPNPQEEHELERIEILLAKVRISRDMAMSLAKDTDPKYLPSNAMKPGSLDKVDPVLVSGHSSKSESPSEGSINGYFGNEVGKERRPFWKRNTSSERRMAGIFKRSVSATPSMTSDRGAPSTATTPQLTSFRVDRPSLPDDGIHEQCMTLLRNLDAIVSDFTQLMDESKQRRAPLPTSSLSRYSVGSQGSEEFFDAEGYDDSQLLAIQPESDDEHENGKGAADEECGSDSDLDDSHSPRKTLSYSATGGKAFPRRPDALSPLPVGKIRRRSILPPSVMPPPSLIGFFRKNVGKDLSTISMPVSANEPLSLLQRASEMLEYSQLLDSAATSTADSTNRLLHIAAFAVSILSSSRSKERALRKPFNPMLGETYELVREDRGFRFLAEKVSHHPVRMAYQAESEKWSLTQAPLPSQKFWGKSAEIITEGKYRIILHATGDRFSWNPPTSFLRNMIAGEKYVEPVGAMNIVNEVTSERAVVTFKSKGMFSGRSEDVIAQLYNIHGEESRLGLVGKWTHSLHVTEDGSPRADAQPIWTVGDLVQDQTKRYGFTAFAASLNETTLLERGKLPPTDSRLRPDQRAAENGDLDKAETLKAKLEEAQRARRRLMEEKGQVWQPIWFKKLNATDATEEEIWVANSGMDSYWEKRQSGNWERVEDIFLV